MCMNVRDMHSFNNLGKPIQSMKVEQEIQKTANNKDIVFSGLLGKWTAGQGWDRRVAWQCSLVLGSGHVLKPQADSLIIKQKIR